MEILATAKAKMAKKAKKAEKAEKAESLRSAFKTAESLRSAVEKETMAYTQAKIAQDKADAKKKADRLYAYLPIGAVFIDEDQKKKKDGDNDSGDVAV